MSAAERKLFLKTWLGNEHYNEVWPDHFVHAWTGWQAARRPAVPRPEPEEPIDTIRCVIDVSELPQTARAKADLYAQVDASMGIVDMARKRRLDRRLEDTGAAPDRRTALFDRRARQAGPAKETPK